MSKKICNPILPGFYPDPSICRVEDDFYLITSSFSYFPGIPVFHSRNLVNWEQVGYALDRPSQLPATPYDISGGIYAPTIRHYNNKFYIAGTNVNYKGNFIITADNPAGPWSEPNYIEDAEGYDPSIFWDDDGKAYFLAAHTPPLATADDQPVIYICEIDMDKFCLIGEKKNLWSGSLAEPVWPEAPHMYKRNGYYYLVIAEGETEHFHSVTVARADTVAGPYHSYRGNPILTQRYLGIHAPIVNVGHADFVELQDGTWYTVFLGSRPYGGYHKNLGRETFIAPVIWEEDWPVINPGYGALQFEYPAPELPEFEVSVKSSKDDFEKEILDFQWNFLGTPDPDLYRIENSVLKIKTKSLAIGKGMAKLKAEQGESLKCPPTALGFVGRRQQHMSFEASACLIFSPVETESAGIVALQNAYQQLRVEISLNEKGKKVIRAIRGYHSLEPTLLHKDDSGEYREEILEEIRWEKEKAILKISANIQQFQLSVLDETNQEVILSSVDGGFLGSETAGGFVGTYIGMFASGNGTEYNDYAYFDWFSYSGKGDRQ